MITRLTFRVKQGYEVLKRVVDVIGQYDRKMLEQLSGYSASLIRDFNCWNPNADVITKSEKWILWDIIGKTKEDASLPKATMTKIIKEMLPPDVRVARDTQDLLIDCCVESNEVCSKEDRKRIAPEHVLKALQVLGFGEYIEDVYAAYEQHKLETMVLVFQT
ncbi:putative transcription factor Hap3/NF-YB family [Helianthus debilis subsp. tardiflorus]